MILLDTCALLWLSSNQELISPETLDVIDKEPIVYVSAITGFEIGIKYRAGKLELPCTPNEWFENIIKHHDLSVIKIDININIRATELPLIHRDPCDRFLIATALIHELTVVTSDRRFEQYGIKVLN